MPNSFRTDLDALIAIFYGDGGEPDSSKPERAELGDFEPVSGADLPLQVRGLLDHNHHMTVTQESFHECPVDVQVLQEARTTETYSRRISLSRQRDGAIVQFGIVRIHTELLDPVVRSEIEACQTPLGRVLIAHNVMRQVELHQLYRIKCGSDLAQVFHCPPGTVVYGRTAVIYCDDKPAIELLEIVPQ